MASHEAEGVVAHGRPRAEQGSSVAIGTGCRIRLYRVGCLGPRVVCVRISVFRPVRSALLGRTRADRAGRRVVYGLASSRLADIGSWCWELLLAGGAKEEHSVAVGSVSSYAPGQESGEGVAVGDRDGAAHDGFRAFAAWAV